MLKATKTELAALSACVNAIKPLTQQQADRIVAYLVKRFTDHKDFS